MIDILHDDSESIARAGAFQGGRSYPLFVGGERRGDVTIQKVTPFQCNSSAAVVSIESSVQLSLNSTGLATMSAEQIRPHINHQRSANDSESAAARKLAMDEFSTHRVPPEMIKDIQIGRLVVTEIDGSGQKILIGSLTVRTDGVQHDIFLIGGSAGEPAQLSRYHRSTDLDDGKDVQKAQFVDQLDLDRDGVDEVIIEVRGYEGLAFAIYRRQNGTWKEIWVGGRSGC